MPREIMIGGRAS